MKTLGQKKSVNSVEEVAVEAGVKDAGAGAGAEAVGSVGEDMIALAVIRLTIVIGHSITMAEQDVVALVVDAEGVDTMTVVTATIAVTVAGVDLAVAIPTATNNLPTNAVATTTAMSAGTSTTITTEVGREINNSGTIDNSSELLHAGLDEYSRREMDLCLDLLHKNSNIFVDLVRVIGVINELHLPRTGSCKEVSRSDDPIPISVSKIFNKTSL